MKKKKYINPRSSAGSEKPVSVNKYTVATGDSSRLTRLLTCSRLPQHAAARATHPTSFRTLIKSQHPPSSLSLSLSLNTYVQQATQLGAPCRQTDRPKQTGKEKVWG